MGIYKELIFTEAVDQVGALLESTNADEISTRLEQIAGNENLAMGCLLLLTLKAKGVDISEINGIQLANTQPTFADLILPSGTK